MRSSTINQCAAAGNQAILVAVALVFAVALLTLPRAAAEPPERKLPIPDPAAQEKVLTTIQDTYQDDYNKDKAGLAGKLLQKA